MHPCPKKNVERVGFSDIGLQGCFDFSSAHFQSHLGYHVANNVRNIIQNDMLGYNFQFNKATKSLINAHSWSYWFLPLLSWACPGAYDRVWDAFESPSVREPSRWRQEMASYRLDSFLSSSLDSGISCEMSIISAHDPYRRLSIFSGYPSVRISPTISSNQWVPGIDRFINVVKLMDDSSPLTCI